MDNLVLSPDLRNFVVVVELDFGDVNHDRVRWPGAQPWAQSASLTNSSHVTLHIKHPSIILFSDYQIPALPQLIFLADDIHIPQVAMDQILPMKFISEAD